MHFPLLGTICIIDTELVEDQIEETEEALNQITFSDVLILNKTEIVNDVYTEEVKNKMASINPMAAIYQSKNGQFPEFDLSK